MKAFQCLIFAMFKDSSSLPMLTQLTVIFCLQFTNYGSFSPKLLFPCFICLVTVMICIFSGEVEFFYGTFVDCIGLFNSHYRSILFQNLYQAVPLSLWQFPKSVCAPFHHKLTQHNLFQVYIQFDACCVSHDLDTYSCLHLCQKRLLMWFILAVILERTIRFLNTVDAVLE